MGINKKITWTKDKFKSIVTIKSHDNQLNTSNSINKHPLNRIINKDNDKNLLKNKNPIHLKQKNLKTNDDLISNNKKITSYTSINGTKNKNTIDTNIKNHSDTDYDDDYESTPTTTTKNSNKVKRNNKIITNKNDTTLLKRTKTSDTQEVEVTIPIIQGNNNDIAQNNDKNKSDEQISASGGDVPLSTERVYSTYSIMEEEEDRMNDDYRFKRSKRPHYRLQDSILGLISKCKTELEHLDDKIKSLESQFFDNPPEATGLIKGWEGNVLNNAYMALSNGLKSRRSLNSKIKTNLTQTQTAITEHIFSLTSSTCSISRMLLNN